MHLNSESTVLQWYRTAKYLSFFSRAGTCLWRKKLPVSLLIRCCNWKTSLFTTDFLESYFSFHCREAVKWNEGRMLGATGGKNSPSFELQILLYDRVQLSEQTTDVDDMNTWRHDGKACRCLCMQTNSPPGFTPPQRICLFGCSVPARPQLATFSASVIPAWGYHQGSAARRLWLE